MTRPSTDPTTDQLTRHIAREIVIGTLSPDWQALDLARALLTSGPLADRLNAGDRAVASLARLREMADSWEITAAAYSSESDRDLIGSAARSVRSVVRGDR